MSLKFLFIFRQKQMYINLDGIQETSFHDMLFKNSVNVKNSCKWLQPFLPSFSLLGKFSKCSWFEPRTRWQGLGFIARMSPLGTPAFSYYYDK